MMARVYIAIRKHSGSGHLGHSRGVQRGTLSRALRLHRKAGSGLLPMPWPAAAARIPTRRMGVGEEESRRSTSLARRARTGCLLKSNHVPEDKGGKRGLSPYCGRAHHAHSPTRIAQARRGRCILGLGAAARAYTHAREAGGAMAGPPAWPGRAAGQ